MKKVRTSITMSPRTLEVVKGIAAREDRSVSAVIERLLLEAMDEVEATILCGPDCSPECDVVEGSIKQVDVFSNEEV